MPLNDSLQNVPLILVTDGSVDTKSKIGFGAYLLVSEGEALPGASILLVQTKRFEDTSSTKLELQTLLWALDSISKNDLQIQIFTDSQNIIGLPERRERLVKNDFRSKAGKPIRNEQLYRNFFESIDTLECRFFKVRGHQPQAGKNEIDRLVTIVDRASRSALRQHRLSIHSTEKSD